MVKMSKRHLDRFDLEAEREGVALRSPVLHTAKPCAVGRGTIKMRKMHHAADKFVECKTIKQSFTKGWHC